MGHASRFCHIILRTCELISSVIVLGLVARFIHLVAMAGGDNDSRLIYTIVLASISTIYSIFFILPLMYAFLAFAADFALFVMWMVAFGLLVGVRLPEVDPRLALIC